MIILDTNVLSALMRQKPDSVLVPWLERQRRGELWTTAINVFELRFGAEAVRDRGRRRGLSHAVDQFLRVYLADRVLHFDPAAARAAAFLEADRKRSGRSYGSRDTLIAGIAIANRAAICTRNVRHFEDAGVAIHDPWA